MGCTNYKLWSYQFMNIGMYTLCCMLFHTGVLRSVHMDIAVRRDYCALGSVQIM